MSETTIRIATRTDVGMVRSRNEDFLATRAVPLGQALVVCDGMGGAAGGSEASTLAANAIIRTLESIPAGSDTSQALVEAYHAAWRAVKEHVAATPEHEAMGTTAVVALVRDGHATLANIGDSRAYLLHDGALRRVTRDHSLVAEMVARGEITEAEAATHPRRNIITRAITAAERDVRPDIVELSFAANDTLLLCSDGLHGMISDSVISGLLSAPDLTGAADKLVEAALTAGGKDNVSVILARKGGSVENDTLVAPRTDPGATTGPRARSSFRWVMPLVLLAALAGAWFFWVGPKYFPRSPLVPGEPDSTEVVEGGDVGQYDSGVGDDFLQTAKGIMIDAFTLPLRPILPAPSDSTNDTAQGRHATPQPASQNARPALPGR